PCGVGPLATKTVWDYVDFNPPTPCGVGPLTVEQAREWAEFQSTHPVWGGTETGANNRVCARISIHPPRVGWDCRSRRRASSAWHFNPPTPCGVGPRPNEAMTPFVIFQSTHPVWGGTDGQCPRYWHRSHFNPPTPCGVGRSRLPLLRS